MKPTSFSSIATKTAVVHTVTYFLVGLLSFISLDYAAKYADPVISNLMRQTNDPLVAAGPAFQLLRGFLLGIVFYALRHIVFPNNHGWLTLWLVLVIVGILAPFAAAPSSIEGMLYSVLPMWFHVANLPEILIQSGTLAWLTHYWVNHPEKKWLGWVMGVITVIVILMSLLGALSALGVLPFNTDKIGVWGGSAGGHLVAMVGLTNGDPAFDAGEYAEQSSRVDAVVEMFGPKFQADRRPDRTQPRSDFHHDGRLF